MNTRATQGYRALTEREKQTLRLIVRGHDAKSIARRLDLSVHTVNERLRDARRKMAVSSSREAARMLLDTEGGEPFEPMSAGPNSCGDTKIGEAGAPPIEERGVAPIGGARRTSRRTSISIGLILMTLALGLVALMALPSLAPTSTQGPGVRSETPDAAVVDAARQWLALVDQARWDESYRATGDSFRKLNTRQTWASVSQKVRTPLGAMLSRDLISEEFLPAPPSGYEVVKFRTSFANKVDAVETVTLNREDGGWHVVGVTIG